MSADENRAIQSVDIYRLCDIGLNLVYQRTKAMLYNSLVRRGY